LVPSSDSDIHIVMDNYATHKTPKIKAWLARRPHYHVHFTPTSASWIKRFPCFATSIPGFCCEREQPNVVGFKLIFTEHAAEPCFRCRP
jgi:hypothetical protein